MFKTGEVGENEGSHAVRVPVWVSHQRWRAMGRLAHSNEQNVGALLVCLPFLPSCLPARLLAPSSCPLALTPTPCHTMSCPHNVPVYISCRQVPLERPCATPAPGALVVRM